MKKAGSADLSTINDPAASGQGIHDTERSEL